MITSANKRLEHTLANAAWIVYPKPVPADPALALDYIARDTHKVALGDSRIQAIAKGRVTYSWRDRADRNIEKLETIPVELFTRRFIAHILPDGFHKIRYFGWMTPPPIVKPSSPPSARRSTPNRRPPPHRNP